MAGAVIETGVGPVSRQFSLPAFFTRGNKYYLGVFLHLCFGLFYLVPNWFHLIEPVELNMYPLDLATPLVPWSINVYNSVIFFYFVTFVVAKDTVALTRYFLSYLTMQMVCCAIFTLWPTTYPRADFPLPEDIHAVNYYLFTFWRTVDTPANCAPSLHVGGSFLAAFLFLDEQKYLFPLFLAWAAAIAAATLTTKQHYTIDVITGILLSVVVRFTYTQLVEFRRPQGRF